MIAAIECQPRVAMTAAALYEGTVAHHRADPHRGFTPKIFLAYLDVDALPHSLDALPLWSGRRRAPARFRRSDFFDGGTAPLGAAVRDLVMARLGRRPAGQIFLLAHVRTFGWIFNPLAVYYCWNADGRGLDALVLEVTNTPWGERQWYVFDARTPTRVATTAKTLHVSPFLPMDVDYRVTWSEPDTDLTLRIDVRARTADGTHSCFEAELALTRVELDRRQAVRVLLRYPLLPQRVSAAIRREAVRLVLARAPRFRHPNRSRGTHS